MNKTLLILLSSLLLNNCLLLSSTRETIENNSLQLKNIIGRFVLGNFCYISEVPVGGPQASIHTNPWWVKYFKGQQDSKMYGETFSTSVLMKGINYGLFSIYEVIDEETLLEIQPKIDQVCVTQNHGTNNITENDEQAEGVSSEQNKNRAKEIIAKRGSWSINYGEILGLTLLGVCVYKGVPSILYNFALSEVHEIAGRTISRFNVMIV